VTSRQAKIVVAAAVGAGGAAGILGAVGAALLLRPTAAAAPSGSASSAAGALVSGHSDPRTDAFLFRKRLEQHEREAVDPSWAIEAQRAHERDLNRLAKEARFSLRGVNCRATSCVADISFASYDAARNSMKIIMLSRWTLNCTREMNLDPVTEESFAYSTSIYFDCASARPSRDR
jgi:hypothetical protein